MNFINYNGKIIPANQPALIAANRGFKYGDGIFETLRFENGKLPLKRLHFERMISGLSALNILCKENFPRLIEKDILELCSLNNITPVARVRVTVFREENNEAGYVIEANAFDQSPGVWLNEAIEICLYRNAVKGTDKFSNLKSCSFLPYTMASVFARSSGYDDALIENHQHRIADSSIANVFIIRNSEISTPALSEGCVAGVMRRFLMENLSKNFNIREATLDVNDLESADEIFLTNALRGILKVKRFEKIHFRHSTLIQEIHRQLVHHLQEEVAGHEG